VTYADLLYEFPSAHPPIQDIVGALVPPIKPRHYSIASSMNMHPDSVHLLVVLHDWKTPSGQLKVP
jgi:sulfite reductase (NADPH) flavoprotein alpha-component